MSTSGSPTHNPLPTSSDDSTYPNRALPNHVRCQNHRLMLMSTLRFQMYLYQKTRLSRMQNTSTRFKWFGLFRISFQATWPVNNSAQHTYGVALVVHVAWEEQGNVMHLNTSTDSIRFALLWNGVMIPSSSELARPNGPP